jgi:uncharacterized membrane protein
MLYAGLKAIHLLSIVVWVGGMFFMLACLRPSLAVLEGPARLRLMKAVMGRFFGVVNAVIGLVLASGLAMLWLNGLTWRLPHAWYAMIVAGLVMMGLFGYIRGTLYRRFVAASEAQDGATAASVLNTIRRAVTVNLLLGVIAIIAMKVGVAG